MVAAHCLVNKEEVKVILGRLKITSKSESDRVERSVLEIKIHENFQENHGTASNSDIALLILNEYIEINDKIRPIRLPSANQSVSSGIKGFVAGYEKNNENLVVSEAQIHDGNCINSQFLSAQVDVVDNFCAKSEKSAACLGEFNITSNNF